MTFKMMILRYLQKIIPIFSKIFVNNILKFNYMEKKSWNLYFQVPEIGGKKQSANQMVPTVYLIINNILLQSSPSCNW